MLSGLVIRALLVPPPPEDRRAAAAGPSPYGRCNGVPAASRPLYPRGKGVSTKGFSRRRAPSKLALDLHSSMWYIGTCGARRAAGTHPLGGRLTVGREALARVAEVRILPSQPAGPHRLVAQDAGFSVLRPGFESPWGHQAIKASAKRGMGRPGAQATGSLPFAQDYAHPESHRTRRNRQELETDVRGM